MHAPAIVALMGNACFKQKEDAPKYLHDHGIPIGYNIEADYQDFVAKPSGSSDDIHRRNRAKRKVSITPSIEAIREREEVGARKHAGRKPAKDPRSFSVLHHMAEGGSYEEEFNQSVSHGKLRAAATKDSLTSELPPPPLTPLTPPPLTPSQITPPPLSPPPATPPTDSPPPELKTGFQDEEFNEYIPRPAIKREDDVERDQLPETPMTSESGLTKTPDSWESPPEPVKAEVTTSENKPGRWTVKKKPEDVFDKDEGLNISNSDMLAQVESLIDDIDKVDPTKRKMQKKSTDVESLIDDIEKVVPIKKKMPKKSTDVTHQKDTMQNWSDDSPWSDEFPSVRNVHKSEDKFRVKEMIPHAPIIHETLQGPQFDDSSEESVELHRPVSSHKEDSQRNVATREKSPAPARDSQSIWTSPGATCFQDSQRPVTSRQEPHLQSTQRGWTSRDVSPAPSPDSQHNWTIREVPPSRDSQRDYISRDIPPSRDSQRGYISREIPPSRDSQRGYSSRDIHPSRDSQRGYISREIPPSRDSQRGYSSRDIPPSRDSQRDWISRELPPSRGSYCPSLLDSPSAPASRQSSQGSVQRSHTGMSSRGSSRHTTEDFRILPPVASHSRKQSLDEVHHTQVPMSTIFANDENIPPLSQRLSENDHQPHSVIRGHNDFDPFDFHNNRPQSTTSSHYEPPSAQECQHNRHNKLSNSSTGHEAQRPFTPGNRSSPDDGMHLPRTVQHDSNHRREMEDGQHRSIVRRTSLGKPSMECVDESQSYDPQHPIQHAERTLPYTPTIPESVETGRRSGLNRNKDEDVLQSPMSHEEAMRRVREKYFAQQNSVNRRILEQARLASEENIQDTHSRYTHLPSVPGTGSVPEGPIPPRKSDSKKAWDLDSSNNNNTVKEEKIHMFNRVVTYRQKDVDPGSIEQEVHMSHLNNTCKVIQYKHILSFTNTSNAAHLRRPCKRKTLLKIFIRKFAHSLKRKCELPGDQSSYETHYVSYLTQPTNNSNNLEDVSKPRLSSGADISRTSTSLTNDNFVTASNHSHILQFRNTIAQSFQYRSSPTLDQPRRSNNDNPSENPSTSRQNDSNHYQTMRSLADQPISQTDRLANNSDRGESLNVRHTTNQSAITSPNKLVIEHQRSVSTQTMSTRVETRDVAMNQSKNNGNHRENTPKNTSASTTRAQTTQSCSDQIWNKIDEPSTSQNKSTSSLSCLNSSQTRNIVGPGRYSSDPLVGSSNGQSGSSLLDQPKETQSMISTRHNVMQPQLDEDNAQTSQDNLVDINSISIKEKLGNADAKNRQRLFFGKLDTDDKKIGDISGSKYYTPAKHIERLTPGRSESSNTDILGILRRAIQGSIGSGEGHGTKTRTSSEPRSPNTIANAGFCQAIESSTYIPSSRLSGNHVCGPTDTNADVYIYDSDSDITLSPAKACFLWLICVCPNRDISS